MSKIKTTWDLSSLFKSDTDPSIKNKRKKVEKQSYKFINKWKDRNDYLKDPKILKQALDEYESWARLYGYGGNERYYFTLRLAKNQNDPKIKAKFNKIADFTIKIQNDIQFFVLKVAKIKPDLQAKFLTHKELQEYKHFLEKLFAQAKYFLSDPEERIINLKSQPSHDNWVHMLSGFLAKEEAKVLTEKAKTQTKTFSDLLGLMNNQNKKVRDSAAKAFNMILEKHVDVAENELNSVLLNKKVDDELRGYNRPDKARHIDDDIDTEVVDALVKAVTSKFQIAKDYYKLKAGLMKVPKLKYHERNVEYGKIDKKYQFKQSYELINKVLSQLDREFAAIFTELVNNGQIDVYPKKGKRSGAFAAHSLITQPSYILLNWTSLLEDVRTFSHELGHVINYELTKNKQNALNFGTPTSVTEVASTFFEDFVLDELKKEANQELKLALMVKKLNDDVSTIFRQIAFYNFETELHQKLRQRRYLSKDEIGKLFQKQMISYMGNYVEQSPGSENWWSYISHFRSFFYVYSYASGLLISKSLQASVKKDPRFILKVKEFLSVGLSDSPKNIFKNLGIDISDKDFWHQGLDEVTNLLKETEQLAKKLGKIN